LAYSVRVHTDKQAKLTNDVVQLLLSVSAISEEITVAIVDLF